MLGIPDPWVAIPFLLCIASMGLCVVYGVMNWNRGAEVESAEIAEESAWEAEEAELNERL